MLLVIYSVDTCGALPTVGKEVLLHLDVALVAQAGDRTVDRLRATAKMLGKLAFRFARSISTDGTKGNIAEQTLLHRGEMLALLLRRRFFL